jgi:hypothetical protein
MSTLTIVGLAAPRRQPLAGAAILPRSLVPPTPRAGSGTTRGESSGDAEGTASGEGCQDGAEASSPDYDGPSLASGAKFALVASAGIAAGVAVGLAMVNGR